MAFVEAWMAQRLMCFSYITQKSDLLTDIKYISLLALLNVSRNEAFRFIKATYETFVSITETFNAQSLTDKE